MDLTRSPENPGTLSWRVLSTLVYSGGRTSVRVDTTWPNLTKLGPNINNPLRIKTAASTLAASISSSVASPFFLIFLGFNTRNTQLSANFHTSALRRMAEELPRASHPSSSNSPSGTGSLGFREAMSLKISSPRSNSLSSLSSSLLRTKPIVPRIKPLILPFARENFPSSTQSSSAG